MSDEKAERPPLVWKFSTPTDYNSKDFPFFYWTAHQMRPEERETFILPKEDPRMDMGRNSEHYSDPHTRHGLGEYAQGGKAAGCRPPCCGFGLGADSAPDSRACGL